MTYWYKGQSYKLHKLAHKRLVLKNDKGYLILSRETFIKNGGYTA